MASGDREPLPPSTAEVRPGAAGLPSTPAHPGEPTVVDGASVPAPDAEGEAPRYQRLRFHARGGLGEVFVAHDVELRREVALKRIRAEHRDDGESRRRFVVEAEVTARLEHPGVVPVHGLVRDAEGAPCYAMRFIEGETLADACARFHAADANPGRDPGERRLALRHLLTRFVAVCNTVAYAHSRGIIHRDLKPANVMLGPYGETLVVDWGLAKPFAAGEEGTAPSAGAGAGGTRIGHTLGTPAYMSPEQAAGRWDRVGPASDVYSLGGTLYTLLVGRPAFEGDDVHAVLEQVQRGEFPKPRQANASVSLPLEAICLKAMAFDPEARYRTALALAADVESWLADEPVGAWREPVRVRLRRWLGRHRTLMTAAAAAALAVLLSLAAASVLLVRAKGEADLQAARAEENFRLARQAVDRFTTEVSEDKLLNEPGMQGLRESLLQAALEFYGRLGEEHANDPALQEELAAAYFRAARIKHVLDRPDAATAYEEALARQRRLADAQPSEERLRGEVAATLQHLGVLAREKGQWDKARDSLREASRLREELARADDPRSRQKLAHAYNSLAVLLARRGERGEGLATHEKALALREALRADDPADFERRADLAQTYSNIGLVHEDESRFDVAAEWYGRAATLREQLARERPRDIALGGDLARSTFNLGNARRRQGQAPEAAEVYERARAVLEPLVRDNPAVVELRRQLGDCCLNIGMVARERGQWAKAIEATKRSVELREELARGAARFRGDLGQACNNLGVWYGDVGDRESARRAYERAREVRDALVKENSKDRGARRALADTLHNFGQLERDGGRRDEALARLRAAEKIQQDLVDAKPDDRDAKHFLARTHHSLGVLLAAGGALDEARTLLEKAKAVREKAAEGGRADARRSLAQTYHALGVVERDAKRNDAAVALLEKARDIQADLAIHSPGRIDYLGEIMLTWSDLGLAQARRGRRDEALAADAAAEEARKAALRLSSELTQFRRLQNAYWTTQTRLRRETGRPSEAVAAALERKRLWPHDAAELFRTARELALCAPLAGKDKTEPTAAERAERQRYSDEALDALREAIFNGYKDVEVLKSEPDLAPLRQDEEFSRLLRRLEEKGKAGS